MNEIENPWTVLSTEIKYDNPWLTVFHHNVLNPNNNPGIYGKIHFKNYAIGIVVLDEDLNTYLVGQFRFPLSNYSWEIPEGGGNRSITPLESAQRELLEEVGLEAKEWTLIQELDLSNSATDEVAYTFLARDLIYKKPQPEDTEQLAIKKLPFEEFFQLVEKGDIRDAISVSACYKVKMMLLSGEI